MTEGLKSLRERFEKLNENQDGTNQHNSLQSQNSSKLVVFLYRNRNEDIISNEEELTSLERSYQAIYKETNNPSLKNKSPIQLLDNISKKYSKLRCRVESKLAVPSPKIHIKRFRADHGSTFYSYKAIYPAIEEKELVNDKPEHDTPETTFEVTLDEPETNTEVITEEVDFYEEYEEYEEHIIVSSSPSDAVKTESFSETLTESKDTILGETTSELPTLSEVLVDSTTATTATTLDNNVVEFEEEDYMESFEEYDIEETPTVDITPMSPVFDKISEKRETKTPETTVVHLDAHQKESEISFSNDHNLIVGESPIKTPEHVLVELHHQMSEKSLQKLDDSETKITVEEFIYPPTEQEVKKTIEEVIQTTVEEVIHSPIEQEVKNTIEEVIHPPIEQEVKNTIEEVIHTQKATNSAKKSLEKQIEEPSRIDKSSNSHEKKETIPVSTKVVTVPEAKEKNIETISKQEEETKNKIPKIEHISITERTSSLPKSKDAQKSEITIPTSETTFVVAKKVEQEIVPKTLNVVLVSQNTKEPCDGVEHPPMNDLPKKTSPILDSTKPLPKPPVKALPVVSPKLKEEVSEITDSQIATKPLELVFAPTVEPIVPEDKSSRLYSESESRTPPATTVVVKNNSEPSSSRTSSIRSYFSSFLSKNQKNPEPKNRTEIKEDIEKNSIMEKEVFVKSIIEQSMNNSSELSESSDTDFISNHSTVNLDDFLDDGEAADFKGDLPSLPHRETESKIEVSIEETVSTIEISPEKTKEERKVSISSVTDSHNSGSEKSDTRKSKRANRKKSCVYHRETGSILLHDLLDSNPSSRSNSITKEVVEEEGIELLSLADFIGEDLAQIPTIFETTSQNRPSRSDSTNNEVTPSSPNPKSLIELYSPITPKRKEKVLESFVDPSTFPKGWEKPYTFLYTEKPLMEHPLLDKLRRNIIELLNSSMTEETRVSGIVNINRNSPLLAPLVHSIYSIIINRTKPTMFKSDRDLCTIFSKLEIVKKEKIVQDFLAFKEVRVLDPKKLKERDLLFIQYLLQTKLLAVCIYELALNQKYTTVCYEETSIMNLAEYSPTIFAVLNLLKKHFNFELKFEFELSHQAGGSKEEGTLTSTLQGNIKTLLQYIIEIGKNEKIPINTITDESKNHNIGKVVRSLVMYILKSILMDKLISESKWKNIAGTLISHPWHLITACAKGELTKAGMIVKTGFSFDSIVLTIDSTVTKKNQTTKQQLLDDKFFSFVAYCLNYQILPDALKFIFKNISILEKNYRPDSIMCDPVQQDQILTILNPLSKLRFTLNFY